MKGKLSGFVLRLLLVTTVLVAGPGLVARTQTPERAAIRRIAAQSLGLAAHAQAPEAGYWERTPLPLTGLATFYADGLMDYVQSYRLGLRQVADCPECVGAVALLRAGDIGRKVWLQPPDGELVGPFMVVDCARREDYPALLARGWAVDVSYELGQLWGMAGPLADVTVLEDPADAAIGPVRPIYAVTPFAVLPGEVVITAPTPTPAETTAAPTPWPTRVPVARRGVSPAPTAAPAAATPLWPPPLTPIVTTPTPQVTPEATAEETLPAERVSAEPTEVPEAEIALGRAGAGLLGQPTAAAPTATPTFTATPKPPQRTPRPDLTPILPDAPGVTPTPQSPFEQLWRALLELIQP